MYLLNEKVRYVAIRPTDQIEHKGKKKFYLLFILIFYFILKAIRKLFKDSEWFQM